jgi:hypothetical protein
MKVTMLVRRRELRRRRVSSDEQAVTPMIKPKLMLANKPTVKKIVNGMDGSELPQLTVARVRFDVGDCCLL